MIKLTFLGSGSAFYIDPADAAAGLPPSNYQSNMLIEHEGKKLLIDCGTDIRFSLGYAGYTINDIDAVYISHPHADHIGGLEMLGFCSYFNPKADRPKMFVSRTFAADLWSRSLSGGMESLQTEIADMSTYFDVVKIKENGKFIWSDIEFQLVQTVHIVNGFSIVPSFGLMFFSPYSKQTVFITSDSQHCPNQMVDFYRKSDVVFHDCETSYKSGVHAHYTELAQLSPDVKSKMWLYHYQPNYKMYNPETDGFNGFVQRGQVFTF